MRLPKVSDLPSTRIQVGISGTKDAYSSNFDATFGARLCGLCMKFGACPRRYEPPEAGDRACIGSYEPDVASGALAWDRGPGNAPEARPGALTSLPEDGDGEDLRGRLLCRVSGGRVRVWIADESDPALPAAVLGEGH